MDHTIGKSFARSLLSLTLLLATSFACLLPARYGGIEFLLVHSLTDRFARNAIIHPESLSGIIVLTGGRGRLAEAGHLARQYPHLKLIITGADEVIDLSPNPLEGIEPARIIIERRATNTYQNASYTYTLIRPGQNSRWLLVTGSLHMPRAVGAFRTAGFDVEPWPVDELTNSRFLNLWAAMREWLGLLFYRILGRSTALLPAPANALRK